MNSLDVAFLCDIFSLLNSYVHSKAGNISNDTSSDENSLSKLVEEQNIELNQLHEEVKTIKSELQNTLSECVLWKSIAAAKSPDDALSEHVQASLSVEKERDALLLQVKSMTDEFHHQLLQKQERVDDLISEVTELREDVLDRDKGTSTLQEELFAIATAYSNLEDEFRKIGKGEVLEANKALTEKETKLEEKVECLEMELKQSHEKLTVSGEDFKLLKEELLLSESNSISLRNHVEQLQSELCKEREALQSTQELGLVSNENEVDEFKKSLMESEANCNSLQKYEQLQMNPSTSSDGSKQIVKNESRDVISQEEFDHLRNTCIAADEWMAMAVERMNAMVAQNSVLIGKLNSSKSVTSRSCQNIDEKGDVEALKSQLDTALELNETLTLRLDDSVREIQMLNNLQTTYSNIEDDVLSREGVLSILKAEKTAILNEKIEEISSLNETIQALNDKINEHNSVFEKKLKKATDSREAELNITIQMLSEKVSLSESELISTKSKLTTILDQATSDKQLLSLEIADLKAENVRLKEEISGLKSHAFEIEYRLDEMKSSYAKLESSYSSLQEEINSGAFEELQKCLAECEEKRKLEVTELQSKLEEFQEWSEMAQNNISELEQEKDSLEKRSQELSSSLQSAKGEISELESCHLNLEVELKQAKETISIKEDEFNEICEENQNVRTDLESSVEQLSELLKEKDKEVVEVRSALLSKEDEGSSLQSELDSMKLKVAQIGTKNKSLDEEIELLRQGNNDCRFNLEVELKQIKETMSIKEGEFNEMCEENQNVRTDLESSIEQLSELLKEKDKEVIQVRRELLSKEDEGSSLQSELDSMKLKMVEIGSKNKSLDEEIELLRQRNNDSIAQSKSLEEQLNTLKLESTAKEQNLQETIHVLREAAEELNCAIKDKNETVLKAEDEITRLTLEFDETIKKSESVVKQWSGKIFSNPIYVYV